MKMFKIKSRLTLPILILILFQSASAFGQSMLRDEIDIPNILGYITLKCDFHMHTVFSDGNVWPTVRVEEAWREGLDAIAITDHIEYQPHQSDVVTNHNRAFEIAQGTAQRLGIILIRGGEITRSMPPGHLNAIFLNDCSELVKEEYIDAIAAAVKQGGFIIWNHPGWRGQQPDGVARWYQDHTELLNKGWLNGIEVVNSTEYYPEVHRWCLDKNLTMFGNSDIHIPTNMFFDFSRGDHRSMTLVFAKKRTKEEIKKALFSRRTAVYFKDKLIGEERFLRPIFKNSISIKNQKIVLKGRAKVALQIHNSSDLVFRLISDSSLDEVKAPKRITLYPHKTVLFSVQAREDSIAFKKKIDLPYRVTNLLIAPETPLPVAITVDVKFIPSKKR